MIPPQSPAPGRIAGQATLPFDGPALPGHPFVDQLAELCRAEPTRARWVFVPAHGAGLVIGDHLARRGAGWVNLHFVTPLEIAIRMAGPFLVERGIEPSEDTLGPPLVMRLLADLRFPARAAGGDASGSGYFQPMADHTTLAAALWSTIRELRLAGVGASDLPASAFEAPVKHAELVALLGAYERYLHTEHVADAAAVLHEASRCPDFCPIAADDLRVEVPDVIWPPLVRRFLDALPGRPVAPRTIALPGLAVPRRIGAQAAAAERIPLPSVSDASRLRFLRAPEPAGPTLRDGTLTVFHAGGREAEVEEVYRRILGSGARLDEVEIVCATDDHALFAWEKARRREWPATLAGGVAATLTRPGRALLAWCKWITGGFASADLRRLLQSGDVAPASFRLPGRPIAPVPAAAITAAPAGEDREDEGEEQGGGVLSAGQAARLLVRAEAAWGRETYARALGRYAAREEHRAAREGATAVAWRLDRAAQARRLLGWIDDLLADVPEPASDGLVAVSAILAAAERFLRANASRAGDLDAAAFVGLADALVALRSLGDMRGAPGLALRFVQDAVECLRVGGSRARPGHLHISALSSPAFTARPFTFIVGLEEGRVFPAAVEDPILLDDERESIATHLGRPALLRTSRDRLDEAVFATVGRIATAGTAEPSVPHPPVRTDPPCVVLSFSCVDTREFRGTFPSWLVLQALRLQRGDRGLGYEQLRHALGEPLSIVPPSGTTSSDAGWWLRSGRAAGGLQAVIESFPGIARGLEADRLREAAPFTAFDGLVPAAGRALDPVASGVAVSPTGLEEIAKCPFRYFLKSALRIDALDSGERDPDVWLDPLRRGAELHDLYAAVTRRARAAGRRVTRAADLAWLVNRGRARLEELRREMPPPSEEVYAAESNEFLDDLAAFAEAEEDQGEITPIAFEVGFGLRGMRHDSAAVDDPQAPETLSSDDPIPVALGAGRVLEVHGRIDRIDRVRAHEYQVVDYKTGRFRQADFTGTFVGGTLMQHALYGRAAEALLRRTDPEARVVRGVYWFPTGRGWGKRVEIEAPPTAVLAEIAGDALEVVRGGTFLQSPEKKVCDWCEYGAACGRSPWLRGQRKRDGDPTALEAWLRLKGRA